MEISHYINIKDLPSLPKGSVFTIVNDETGKPKEIFSGDVRFPYSFTIYYPQWFKPVDLKKHEKEFKKSFFNYGKHVKKLKKKRIEKAWEYFMEGDKNDQA